LGSAIGVPRPVFDPDDGSVPEDTMSEITRSIRVHQRRACDRNRTDTEHEASATNASRLSTMPGLHAVGSFVTVDLTGEERTLFSRLTQRDASSEMGLAVPLCPGGAACVAISVHRGLRLVTADTDAIRALSNLAPLDGNHLRIRTLLLNAVRSHVVTRRDAIEIHAELQRFGLHDSEPLFSHA
jgi:hypothetical protein